jgi:hypothetical protein
MSSEANFRIELTEGQINNAIAVALAETFTDERRDAMLRDIIRAHLAYKGDSYYNKETILSKVVGEQVRKMVNERLLAKVVEWRPQIEDVVDRTLGPSARDAVCAALGRALAGVKLDNLTVSLDAKGD